jgi:hypothetical protein
MRVLLCRDGIAFIKHGVRSDYVWDDLECQYRCITEHYVNGVHQRTTHVYTMETVDGEKLAFDDSFHNVKLLGDAIAEQIAQRELPLVRAAYDAGQVVYFDKLGVCRKGLIYKEERLPWRDISGVRVKEGYISVSKKGKWFNWCSIALSEVPNVDVFLTLVDEIIRIKAG